MKKRIVQDWHALLHYNFILCCSALRRFGQRPPHEDQQTIHGDQQTLHVDQQIPQEDQQTLHGDLEESWRSTEARLYEWSLNAVVDGDL